MFALGQTLDQLAVSPFQAQRKAGPVTCREKVVLHLGHNAAHYKHVLAILKTNKLFERLIIIALLKISPLWS